MKIGVIRETFDGEKRVASTPDVVAKLVKKGFEVAVEKGDVVLVTSDGAPEAIAPTGELFGYERVVEYLTGCDGQAAVSIVDGLIDAVTSFGEDSPLHDDVTVLAMVVE